METTLHRQLKEKFRESNSHIEVKLGRYRIDVVNGGRLMEIQRSGLAAIRDKINKLLHDGYTVDVVKPLVSRKRLIKLNRKNGKEVDRRWSPRKGSILDLFDELIYFTRVFPHPNLTLITPLIQIEEIRYPGHGKRRRRRAGDFVVSDRLILDMEDAYTFKTVHDLHSLLPKKLPKTFDTKELASCMGIKRHDAQRIAYVMRKTGAAIEEGKRGNAILCRLATKQESSKAMKQMKPKQKAIVAAADKLEKAKIVAEARDAKNNVRNEVGAVVKTAAKKRAKPTQKKTTTAKMTSKKLKKTSTRRKQKSKAA
ncbi:MAG: hypothetical protein AB8B55_06715 [Mariniblastus sp.]